MTSNHVKRLITFFIVRLRSMVIVIFVASWVMPSSVVGLLRYWVVACPSMSIRSDLEGSHPLLIFLCIWRERNGRHFEDVEMPMRRLNNYFLDFVIFFGLRGDTESSCIVYRFFGICVLNKGSLAHSLPLHLGFAPCGLL